MKKNKKQRRVMFLLILILGITIGFALLSTTLFINGTANIKSNTWNIHWDDTSVNVTTGSVSATDPVVSTVTSSKDTVSFDVEFELPGDYYEFTINAINEGSVDGELDLAENWITYKSDNVETTLPEYMNFKVTYDDDTTPTSGDVLKAGKSKTYKIRVEFKSEVDVIPRPTPHPINIEVEVPYVQHKDKGIKYDLGDLVYFDPASDSPCNSTTFDIDKVKSNQSTCYKWRVIVNDDTEEKTEIKLQMDHNYYHKISWNSVQNQYTKFGPSNIMNAFTSMTTNWTRVPLLNFSYDGSEAREYYDAHNSDYYGGFDTYVCINGTCTIKRAGNITNMSSNTRARMITAEEILEIVQTEFPDATWNQTSLYADTVTITNSNNKKLAWLLENTIGGSTGESSGSTASEYYYGETNNGYWTMTPSSFNFNYAWMVHAIGSMDCYVGIHDSYNVGARPVVERVQKSMITKE